MSPTANPKDTNTHRQSDPQFVCSIVIRAYNEEQHIARLLDGIAQQNIKDLEVILVDSGSTDHTVSIASTYNQYFPLNIVRIHPDEFTFGRSLNLGISHSDSDLIVIASAHVYPVYPDWLERLLAPFQNSQVALTYGKQRGNQATKYSEQQVFERWYPDQSRSHQAFPFCNNANAAIRRSLWEENPYDETISGLEDIAWANWVIDQGRTIAYVTEAEIVHVHNETPHAVYNRYRREAMAFKHIFPNENFSLWDFVRLTSTNIASDLRQAAKRRVLLKNISSIFWFRWMQFWGTYQGYQQSGPLTWQLRQTFYYPHGIKKISQSIERTIEPIRYND
jgi:glycosyltransferase involved in cell wall biosynthesis